jgi:hypothetical protein
LTALLTRVRLFQIDNVTRLSICAVHGVKFIIHDYLYTDMQIRSAVARISIATLVLSVLALGAGGPIGAVAAQDGDCQMGSPEQMENCDDPSLNPFEGMLENIYSIAEAGLQYSGFVAVFAGVSLWFGTSNNSDRAQIGVWLTVGGLAMIVLFFGFSSIVELLKYIGNGG